jgi:quercetin dioxygenase-like cupin family protein
MKLTALVGLIVGALGLSMVYAQSLAPTETKGVSAVALRSLDLSDEMDFVKGRSLRMRKVTLQPGGIIGLHNHVGRPAISYVLEGEVVYHQEGKPDVFLTPGQGFAEGKATTHWAENRGRVPAVWIAVDIPSDANNR